MNWPPVKAWTSKAYIKKQRHFVAINYGGDLLERWVVLMSVIDSSILTKVSWVELIDPSIWQCGWDEINYVISSNLVPDALVVTFNDQSAVAVLGVKVASVAVIPPLVALVTAMFEASQVSKADPYF